MIILTRKTQRFSLLEFYVVLQDFSANSLQMAFSKINDSGPKFQICTETLLDSKIFKITPAFRLTEELFAILNLFD